MNVENLRFGRKPDVDWSAVKSDYEAGDLAVREIARCHGVSDTSVHKRAKAELWQHGLQPAEVSELPLVQPESQTTAHAVQTTNPGRCKPDEFDWSRDNESVIIPDQQKIAIFRNHWDQIVIREERTWGADSDLWIRFNPEHLPRVIEKLQALLAGED